MGGKNWWAIFWAVFLFLPIFVSARVVINEVKISGSGGVNDEFVELYNSATDSVDIGNWNLYKYTKLSTSTAADSGDKILISQIPFGTVMPGATYFLLAHGGFEANTSTETPDLVYTTNSLASDNTVFLCRENDEIEDLVGYGDATAFEGAGSALDPKTKSIVRNNYYDTNNNLADFIILDTPTPQNSQYIFVEEIDASDITPTSSTSTANTATSTEDVMAVTSSKMILINEILPNPVLDTEWIEMYNPNTTTVEMAGWKIFDGISERAILTSTIMALDFLVVDFSNVLNNSGDKVILKNHLGNVIDEMIYGDWLGEGLSADLPKVGESLARKNDGQDTDNSFVDFAVTVSTTKGFANIITAPSVPIVTPQSSYSSSPGSRNTETFDINKSYSDKIKLNELVSDPADGQTEFVELKNYGSVAVDLSGWYLKDGGGNRTEISGAVLAGSFVVIDSPRGNLNNSGEQINLYSPDNVLRDSVSYGDWKSNKMENNAPRADDPLSLARSATTTMTGVNKIDWSVTMVITRGAENMISAATSLSKNSDTSMTSTINESKVDLSDNNCPVNSTGWDLLLITEIFPNPKGGEEGEYIEIFNNSSSTVELCGLLLDDEDGGSRLFRISTSTLLGAKEYIAFYRTITKLAFNNDADEARILTASGTIIDSVSYEKGKEGQSYALAENNDWYWVGPTPNAKNQVPLSATISEKSVAGTKVKKSSVGWVGNLVDLSSSEKGDRVDLLGVVSVPPATFGAQYFYIYSTTTATGAEVYMNKKNFPILRVGDVVRVRGTVSESYGQKRINIKTSSDIDKRSENADLNYLEANLDGVGVFGNGALISVSGEVTEVKSSYIYLDDGTGEIKMYLKKGTGLSTKQYAIGDNLKVKGVLIDSGKELQIQPRFREDIVIQKMQVAGEKIANQSVASGFDYWHAILFSSTIFFASYWLRHSGVASLKKYFQKNNAKI